MNWIEEIKKQILDSARMKQQMADTMPAGIQAVSEAVTGALRRGNKILLCGNGGSAADSQHIAAEFVGRFKRERPGLAAVALTTDTSILTSVSNDYGFENIFARQVEALGREGDVLIGFSTSGKSKNIIRAFESAKKRDMVIIAFAGSQPCAMTEMADLSILIPADETARIQEGHILVGHILCDMVEYSFSQSAGRVT